MSELIERYHRQVVAGHEFASMFFDGDAMLNDDQILDLLNGAAKQAEEIKKLNESIVILASSMKTQHLQELAKQAERVKALEGLLREAPNHAYGNDHEDWLIRIETALEKKQ